MEEQHEEIRRIFEEGQRKAREQASIYWASDATKVRVSKPWEFMRSYDLDELAKVAVEMGWAENRVQVKKYQVNEEQFEYYIEPYEDCNCPSILKYEDYIVPDTGETDG